MNLTFEKNFAIGRSEIGNDSRPVLVAETACAHEGSPAEAKKLVDGAAAAGADLIQLQIFRADEQVGKNHRIYGLLTSLELSDQEWEGVFAHAGQSGSDTMAFVYDLPSLELALRFEPAALKLNSSDLVNGPMLKACAESGLPIFLGTGASRIEEITEALNWIQECGGSKLILMHGIQDFPTQLEDSRLKRIEVLKKIFGLPVGYGDHTDSSLPLAPYVDYLALGLGVNCLEKHITIDRDLKKTDYQAALNPDQWKSYAENIHAAWSALRDHCPIDLTAADQRYRQFQKKYAVLKEGIKVGDSIGIEDVKLHRVEETGGMSGLEFEKGRRFIALRDLDGGHTLSRSDLEALPA